MPRKQCIIFAIREIDTQIIRSVSRSTVSYYNACMRHRYNSTEPSVQSYSMPIYRFIRARGWDAFEFVLLETVISMDKADHNLRKAHYVDLHFDTTISKELDLAYFEQMKMMN